MSGLTEDQLLHLVGRAERHVLTASEGVLLRGAVKDLLARVVIAEGAAGQLSADLRGVRLERNEAVMESVLSGVWSVDCSSCGAAAGTRCVAKRGARPPQMPHAARWEALRARVGEQR